MINSTIFNTLKNTKQQNAHQKHKEASFLPVQYKPIELPNENRNYCIVDKNKVDFYISQREKALPQLENTLKNTNDEKEVTETLYILDQMIDNGVRGVDKMYPTLAKFNETKSPNVQTFLAGIYRKIQVPDAFGPLITMLIQNSINPPQKPQYFNPNEEIGGAILSYLA